MDGSQEKKAPPPREETPSPVPERTDVIVRGGASRCPHCHDTVNSEEDAWAACRGCLARHHVDCWGEGGACGACGEKRFVSSMPRRKAAGQHDMRLKLMTFLAGCLGFALIYTTTEARNQAKRADEALRDLARASRPVDASDLRGITTRTFSSHGAYEVVFTPAGGKIMVLTMPHHTLDEYALAIARVVNSGDQLQDSAKMVPILTTVESVMAKDPDRTADLEKIRAALKVLKP